MKDCVAHWLTCGLLPDMSVQKKVPYAVYELFAAVARAILAFTTKLILFKISVYVLRGIVYPTSM